jgi:polyhydroxybutyrate depolymerase
VLIARPVSGFRSIMSRRLRRLSATLVALCIAASVLFLAAQTETTDRAVAAVDCQPLAGDHTLPGDALLHVPARAKGPLPLVIAFHGAGGTGPGMADYSGLSDTADAKGFAVLYPTAATKRHFWSLNASMPGDDVNRLRALLPQAMAAACADPARVFATGVSNGGGFAARVGCELAGTIAAIAPVAGGYKALDRCPDGRQTSVLEIHGTADHVVPYAGRASDGAGAVAGFLAGWVHRDGCDEKATRSNPRHGVVRFTHRGCDVGFQVEHLRLAGTDHGWPGADPPWPRHNPSQLEADDEVWAFFARVSAHQH